MPNEETTEAMTFLKSTKEKRFIRFTLGFDNDWNSEIERRANFFAQQFNLHWSDEPRTVQGPGGPIQVPNELDVPGKWEAHGTNGLNVILWAYREKQYLLSVDPTLEKKGRLPGLDRVEEFFSVEAEMKDGTRMRILDMKEGDYANATGRVIVTKK